MPRTKEDAAAYGREYYKTPAGKKSRRISRWKQQGIICDDWDALHKQFMSTTALCGTGIAMPVCGSIGNLFGIAYVDARLKTFA